MMNLETALKKYWNYMIRKGSPEKNIYSYQKKVLKIYQKCKTIEKRQDLSAKKIENCIRKANRSQNTKAAMSYQMKSFLNFCILENIQVCNPKKILSPKFEDKEARYLKENEINKILKAIKTKDRKFRAAIILLLTTGTRISEACSITKKQIQEALCLWNFYQISICWKRRKTRAIFIPKKTWKLCQDLINLHKEKNILGLTKEKLSREIRELSESLRVKFTAHSFRHTYLTRLAQNGADIYKIQKIAGHSSIITTTRYLHSCNRELAQTAELANFSI